MVASSAVYVPVASPAVTPHPYGLFSVAPPQAPTEPNWLSGVTWRSVACSGQIGATTDACINGTTPAAKTVTACPQVNVNVKPFTVYAFHKLSGQSFDVAEAEAREVLQAGEEYGVERYLWSTMTTAAPPTAAGDNALEALGEVEQELGQNYRGTGVIHMGRALATLLSPVLLRSGGQLQTTLGTPIVAGGGYDVDAVRGGPYVLFGSGAVTVRRSQLDVVRAADSAHNDLFALAERSYVVGWDCFIIGRQTTPA